MGRARCDVTLGSCSICHRAASWRSSWHLVSALRRSSFNGTHISSPLIMSMKSCQGARRVSICNRRRHGTRARARCFPACRPAICTAIDAHLHVAECIKCVVLRSNLGKGRARAGNITTPSGARCACELLRSFRAAREGARAGQAARLWSRAGVGHGGLDQPNRGRERESFLPVCTCGRGVFPPRVKTGRFGSGVGLSNASATRRRVDVHWVQRVLDSRAEGGGNERNSQRPVGGKERFNSTIAPLPQQTT